MENIDLDSVLFGLLIAVLVYKYFDARNYFRQAKTAQTQEETVKSVRCSVEYDPNDPKHKVVYLFDRQTDQFLTQAGNIKEAVKNLVRQVYEVITFHPDHCPPEVFEQTKRITINDITRVLS